MTQSRSGFTEVVRGIAFASLLAAAGCTTSSSGDGGGGPGSAGGSGTAPAGVAPLASTTFVYVKIVREGADHIVAHDVATGDERTITALDDDGQHGIKVGEIALSPDRTRVAFHSIFRVTTEDAYTPGDADALWSVPVDGSTFTRLTPTLPKPSDDRCTTDLDCSLLNHGTCATQIHHCFPKDFDVSRGGPAWTPDSNTVFFHFGQYWTDYQTGKLAGGTTVASVAAGGGEPALYTQMNDGCAVAQAPAISPDGTKVATLRSVCISGTSYGTIEVYGIPPTKPLSQLPNTSGVGNLTWTPDGKSILYLGQTGLTSPVSVLRQALDGSPAQVLYAGTKDAQVSSFALSPDGKQGIVGLSTGKLVWVKPDGSSTMLIGDGVSYSPTWK